MTSRVDKSGLILQNRVGKAIHGGEAAYAKALRSGVSGEEEKERCRPSRQAESHQLGF